MGRYEQYQRDTRDTEKGVHPVWRGIGFLLMGLVAVMSYAGANLLVEANKTKGWIAVPYSIRHYNYCLFPDLQSHSSTGSL